MFTLINGLPDHVIGIEVSERITADDYRIHLIPVIEEKLQRHKKLDVICRITENFDGIEPGAMWEDLRLGIGKFSHWGRIAVVSDLDWLENTVNMFKILWPGHLRHFDSDEYDQACKWVFETYRASILCEIDADNELLILEPDQKRGLSEDDFARVTEVVDDYLKDHPQLNGILIISKHFPGWQGMGAMLSHMSFVRDHHRKIKRIAIVTDSPLGKFADYAVDHFIKADVRSFEHDKKSQALDWLRS